MGANRWASEGVASYAMVTLLLAALTLSCTGEAPQREQWRRGCRMQLGLAAGPGGTVSETDVDVCALELEGYPVEVANDLGRCMETAATIASCQSEATTRYLADRQRALLALQGLQERLASQLRDAPDDAAAAAPTVPSLEALGTPLEPGPWGEAPRVLTRDDGGWELCDAGPDDKFDTRDDLCVGPAFIYFQF